MSAPLSDEDLQALYVWVDGIPLSRPKRNIARDFCDGVLAAEIVAHFFPKLVELHNYSAAHSTRQKLYNWATLNLKVLKKIGYQIPQDVIEQVVNCQPTAIEGVLHALKQKLAAYAARKDQKGDASHRAPEDSPVSYTPMPAPVAVKQQQQQPLSSAAPMAGFGGQAMMMGGGPMPAHAMGRQGAAPPMQAAPAAMAAPAAAPMPASKAEPASGPVSGDAARIIAEKNQTIQELRETIEILELKIKKLEQLVKLKDSRIQTLSARLQSNELAAQ